MRNLLIVLILLLAACAGPGGHSVLDEVFGAGTYSRTHQAGSANSTLTVVNQRSGERRTETYRVNGRIDAKAMQRLSVIFRDMTNGQVKPIDPALLDFMVAVRSKLQLPVHTPLIITSGYRSPASNRRTRHAADQSYHLRGQAVDIKIDGVDGRRIEAAAKALRRGGVARYARTGHVHLDTGPVRTWYTR